MAALTVAQLAACVTCHAWNGDFSLLALCPNSSEVVVYRAPYKEAAGDWERVAVLKKHDQLVAGIHWAPTTNRIVTCSHDRNAYVWHHDGNAWVPTLVLLRLQRAAVAVEWSPKENKFAIGSGAKTVLVCYYEEENNWWVSKVVKKKHGSTVTAVAWHPNNALLATASTDCKCRVFNAYVKAVDDKGDAVGDTKFGDMLLQVDGAGGWLHSVKWSPSGEQLAFAAHDSVLHFYDLAVAEGPLKQQRLPLRSLPFRALLFLSDTRVVAAGYDNNPALFARDAAGLWSFVKFVDEPQSSSAASSGGPKLTSQFSMGLERFKGQDKHGEAPESGDLTKASPTVHENTITAMHPMAAANALLATTRFSSSGLDGRVVVWDLGSSLLGMAGLTLNS